MTAAIDTPWARALARSTATKTCGWLARNVVVTPARPGWAAAASASASTAACSAPGPSAARSCTCSLKPPVLPMPSTGGAENTDPIASGMSAEARRSRRTMLAACFSGSTARAAKGSSKTNIPPAFGRLVLVINE